MPSAFIPAGLGYSAIGLDNTGVHPESYGAAEALLTLCGYGLSDVKAGGLDGLRERVAAYGEERAAAAGGGAGKFDP